MNWKIASFVALIIVVLGVGAYVISKKPAAPTAEQTQQQVDAATASSTVQAQDVSVGTGAAAVPGSVVSVLYVGKLPDGTVFDSSAAHNNEPLVFQLGTQGLIPGFQIGVNGMKEGGERLMAVPPELGYGAQDVKDANGKVIIPANSTIIFDVKLVKVEPAPANGAPAAQ
ncbi:FKBP-type peptidyl-prolyl cis-trans isomerase [Candidatus Kaiserbacteria bacterium]|nr:FKBP-type peptidyl-prolyl cis-trans isomerase [Candidatus Kaiserbacteria bacterium]